MTGKHSTNSTRSGIVWSGSLAAAVVATQIGHTVLAARVLSPQDFGVYALALTIVQLVGYGATAGLSASITRAPRDEVQPQRTALAISLPISLLLGLLIAGVAPLVRDLFDASHQMVVLLRLLAPSSMLTSTAIIGLSVYRRNLKFKTAAAIESGGVFIGLLTSATLLILGFGTTSLGIGLLSGQLISVIAIVRQLGTPSYDRRAAARVWHFGSQIGFQNIAHFCAYTSPIWILGTLSTSDSVGQFARAWSLVTLPLGQIMLSTTKILQAAYPVREGQLRFEVTAVQTARILSICLGLVLPLFVFAVVGAPSVITFLLGDDWKVAGHIASALLIFGIMNLAYTLAASLNESYSLMRRVWIGIALYAVGLSIGTAIAWSLTSAIWAATCGIIFAQAWALLPYVKSVITTPGARLEFDARLALSGVLSSVVVGALTLVLWSPAGTVVALGASGLWSIGYCLAQFRRLGRVVRSA